MKRHREAYSALGVLKSRRYGTRLRRNSAHGEVGPIDPLLAAPGLLKKILIDIYISALEGLDILNDINH